MRETTRPPATPPLGLEPPIKRRRLDAAGAQDAILRAAESLLVKAGPVALRLTEIAAIAGVSHPNILYHFGSVAGLQDQLAQRVAVRLADEVALAFAAGGADLPIAGAVDAVFKVFDEGGYARLLAWIALSGHHPRFDLLGSRLELVRSAISVHPALGGEDNVERRRLVIPAIELVIVSAIGYALVGHTLDGFFEADERRPSVKQALARLLLTGERR